MKYIIVPTILSLLVAMAACGDPETLETSSGDIAEDIAQASCERAVDCGFESQATVDECVDFIVADICSIVSCFTEVRVDFSDYNACIDAIGELSCNLLEQGILPSECNTIMAT